MHWLILGTFLFYSLNVTGFKVGSFILVDGSCLKTEPIDMAYWVPYLVSVITFWIWPNVGQWLLLGFFTLSALTLSFTTIRYILFPNEKKTRSYNKYFEKTHHVIRPSESRLIPDTFHLSLLILIPINLLGLVIYIIS